MKKIYTFILTGAAILALAACNKDLQIEDNSQINGPVFETLSVKVGPETKVSLATDAAISAFEEGDQIAVWTEAGSFKTCAVDGTGKITVDISGGARSNYAVYYNGATAPTFESSTLKITLPDTYNYADVAGTKNPVPMVAKNVAGDGADMTFYAVCALARITLTGIPATANKLIVNFGQEVTGLFTVDDPGTDHPSITSEGSATSQVTINLTPGTDYTGAVINIPVPQTFKSSEASAYIEAKNGDMLIDTQYGIFGPSWVPARAKGKKAIVNFTPSIYSMIFTPGNLYSESGTLKIADNWYDHMYAFSGNNNDYNSSGYTAANRTHFNFNETKALMSGTSPSALTYTTATTNVGSFESAVVTINFNSYRLPSLADWTAMTTGDRTGATLNATVGVNPPASSTGWKFIKILVTDMEGKGTSSDDGTTALAADATGPSTNYQTGLLLFPDNVEIDGTFTVLGTQNKADACAYSTTQITKTNLDGLISHGCAFLPAVGRWSSSSFGLVGTFASYWSSTSYTTADGFMLYCFTDLVKPNTAYPKSTTFRPVRLVKK